MVKCSPYNYFLLFLTSYNLYSVQLISIIVLVILDTICDNRVVSINIAGLFEHIQLKHSFQWAKSNLTKAFKSGQL